MRSPVSRIRQCRLHGAGAETDAQLPPQGRLRLTLPGIGVVIVSYNSRREILDCVESVLSAGYSRLRIVICDNASPDDTPTLIRDWAAGHHVDRPRKIHPISWPAFDHERFAFEEVGVEAVRSNAAPGWSSVQLICSRINLGFARGVNLAVSLLKADPKVDLFWILNPDCIVPPGTPAIFARTHLREPEVGMIGSRVLFADRPDTIQADGGGQVDPWTGNARSVNELAAHSQTQRPMSERFDYIVGSNVVVTRSFLDVAGPMPEEYFLFYEEVDWAARRSTLKLGYADGGIVYHHGGTATGSWAPDRRPSDFTYFFMFRNRMRFVRRYMPLALPYAYGHALLRVLGILIVRRARPEAYAALRGMHGLPPPAAVGARIDATAHRLAFGGNRRGPT